MRRLILVGILCLILVSIVGAAGFYYHYHPSEGGVKTTEITEYVDSVLLANSSKISWPMDMEPGESYTKNYTVVNTGATVISVRLKIYDLPSGWSLTWAANNTALKSGEAAIGDLVLTVGAGATDGTYYWDHYLEAIK